MEGDRCLKESYSGSQQHSEIELSGFYLRGLKDFSIKFWLILDLLA